ncbi:hypothetical protein QBC38DRAFT_102566 [Podospora fimiseda]|uniref:Uncharacterized protein n=1 Tax=Podospora fimiseda TaxID=252190 RepID=A0AAN6YPG1_9PEZI|nr:hypothetical protein QBC38DRAFT_102566 [Podospora fimiseda]
MKLAKLLPKHDLDIFHNSIEVSQTKRQNMHHRLTLFERHVHFPPFQRNALESGTSSILVSVISSGPPRSMARGRGFGNWHRDFFFLFFLFIIAHQEARSCRMSHHLTKRYHDQKHVHNGTDCMPNLPNNNTMEKVKWRKQALHPTHGGQEDCSPHILVIKTPPVKSGVTAGSIHTRRNSDAGTQGQGKIASKTTHGPLFSSSSSVGVLRPLGSYQSSHPLRQARATAVLRFGLVIPSFVCKPSGTALKKELCSTCLQHGYTWSSACGCTVHAVRQQRVCYIIFLVSGVRSGLQIEDSFDGKPDT